MKYIAAIFILWSAIHDISFAKYNLRKKNRMAAVGAIIFAILTVSIPILVMIIGNRR